jgi:CRISPR-associated protein (TIGR03986 family)
MTNGNRAHAPYNFVPLPDQVVAAEPVPDQDQYHADRYTGYFDVTLTTEAPLYVRGMLTEQEAKDKDANKNKPEFFQVGGRPVIPGSSLRGMIRSLVEIITFSKMSRVSDKPKIFFRAVAAKSDDPLGKYYKEVTGQLGSKIRAGFLKKDGSNWLIIPAEQREGKTFAKVRDLDNAGRVPANPLNVKNIIHLNDARYVVQYHDVMIDEVVSTKAGLRATVRSPRSGEARQGVLVCTGNMSEAGRAGGRVATGRRNFTVVFGESNDAMPLRISPQAVKDYADGLTPFLREQPFDENWGCLIDGRPVFYVPPQQGEDVYYFGHAPFSRIPAMLTYIDENNQRKRRAVTPRDFIPRGVGDNPTHYDMAEAMFGYVDKGDKKATQGEKSRAYASRVSITDARPVEGQRDFYEEEFTPKILGGPKPTTFQHYLEQSANAQKADLKHYASASNETKIRGHKLYWRQKGIRVENVKEDQDKVKQGGDTQHTKMKPVKAGVRFAFRVYFENLSKAELGALAWALELPVSAAHRHQLGMGKPYGMGTVKLEPKLVLREDVKARYQTLFEGENWQIGASEAKAETFIEAFEQYVMNGLGKKGKLIGERRIKELCVMLTLQDPDPDKFSYMQIEGPNNNEYKDRPVLPHPSLVAPQSVPPQPEIPIPDGTLIEAKVKDPTVMLVIVISPEEYGGQEVTLPPDPKRGRSQSIYLVKESNGKFGILSKAEWKSRKAERGQA